MDPTTLVVAAGAVATGIGALLRGRGRKLEAEGEQDSANAKAVTKVLAMVTDLEERVATLEKELDEEREARLAAEKRATKAETALEFERQQSLKLLAEYRASLEKANASTRSWRP